ncbi:MAG: sigma-54 dependent transcriptional regulator [Myxococcota bacterium]|nr:sigma-54 dependent transcriptional regulator [Myxococcota bacterium]
MLDEGLSHAGFAVEWRTSAEEGLRLLREGAAFDVVLSDLRMGGASGLDLCRAVGELDPALPVIVITAFGSIRTAVDAIRSGAYDFITKPFDLAVVAMALDRAVRHRALRLEIDRLRSRVAAEDGGELVGRTDAMRRVFDLIQRAASSDATVLITGESGTGKELAARALHQKSPRAAGPFVAINCAALPETLLESELFGHAKGAFTDARADRTGLFVRASGGTLFLDEIGDMPQGMQVKLLRALQERSVRPVGGDREITFDARILAATHKDLEVEVAAGRFRQDLFFRIHVIEIGMPPLRARGGDVLVLAQTFVERIGARTGRPGLRISHEAAERLLAYDWPGNVRELENSIERAVALARGDEITPEDLPSRVRRTSVPSIGDGEPQGASDLVSLDEMERRYILRVIRAVGGNKKVAAQVLGVDRSTLYRKLDRWKVPERDEG